jgi:hypothetical protein
MEIRRSSSGSDAGKMVEVLLVDMPRSILLGPVAGKRAHRAVVEVG